MSSNQELLGSFLDLRTKRAARAAVPTFLELGTIESGLYLKTDSLKDSIPPSQYMVSIMLAHDTYYTYNELNSSANAPHVHEGGTHAQKGGSGYHVHNSDGLHDHRQSSVFRNLKPGDRVLVAWCGVEPVVVTVVVSGDVRISN